MSSTLRNARAAQRRQRAREQDEDSSEDEVEETQRSQTKRKKGKQRARDDEEEDDDDEPMMSQRRTQTQGGTQGLSVDSIGSAAFKKKVHDLVKLALYHENRKQPLRKDDINKKVMDRANAKVFNALFDEAQTILRSKFGLELVGLRQRVEAAGDGGAAGGTIDLDGDEEAPAKGASKKNSTPAAKGFILRSTLPESLIPLLNAPRPISLEGSDAHLDLAAPTGGEGDGTVDCGALIDWQKGDGGPTGGVAMVGLLWVVLGTILVHDRTMLEDRLKTIFKEKLDISDNTILPLLSRDAVKRQITFDEFLKSLLKQHYLEKVKLSGVNQGEQQNELRWGPRADAEFGEKAVAEFMVDIMTTRAPSEPESEDDGPRQTRGRGGRNGQAQAQKQARETPEQRRAKMLENVKQAAGSDLLPSTKV